MEAGSVPAAEADRSKEPGRWTHKGYASAVSRTCEIWSFALRMLFAELRLRRMSDPDVAAAERILLAARLKDGLLSLGPTFIKLGQLLSTRVDVVPAEYVAALSSLQDRVPGFSGELAAETIENELGRSLSELFDSFELEPIAAASLGQVHRAVYEGRQVAVKVQRSGLRELFDVDLKNLRALAVLADKLDSRTGTDDASWERVYDESARLLWEEIDYMVEGTNGDRFRRNFADIPWVKVPIVYWERTSEKVLTMEFVPGVKISDTDALAAMGVDPVVVARRSAEAFLIQVLRHGFFHGDCHPGNLNVDAVADGRLIYYDTGTMSEVPPAVREGLVDALFGIYGGSEKDVVDAMSKMGVLKRGADRVGVEKIGRSLLTSFRGALAAGSTNSERRTDVTRRLDMIGEDLLSVGDDAPFRFPPVFAFVYRSFSTLEGIGKGLDPNYDLTAVAGPFLRELADIRGGLNGTGSGLGIGAALTVAQNGLKRVGLRPKDLATVVMQPRKVAYVEETMRRMASGDLKLRVRVLDSERSLRRMSLVQDNLGTALLAATACNIASVLMTSAERYASSSRIMWVVAAVSLLKLAIGMAKLRAMDRRLARFSV